MVAQRRDFEYFERLVYDRSGRQRFTQDSPILLDVFVQYGEQHDRQDLLITPDWSRSAGELAARLRGTLVAGDDAPTAPSPSARSEAEDQLEIAYNIGVVAIRLTFRELVEHVLPASWWWSNWLITLEGMTPCQVFADPANPDLAEVAEMQLRLGLERLFAEGRRATTDGPVGSTGSGSEWLFRDDLVWAARLFYVIEHSNQPDISDSDDDDARAIASWFRKLIESIPRERELTADETPWVFSVNRNRTIHRSTRYSVRTTKADAVHRAFDTRGDGIRWAVVDTGVDATHIAFRLKNKETGLPYEMPFDGDVNRTRIKATYDFSDIRKRLSVEQRQMFNNQSGRTVDWEALEETLRLRVPHTSEGYRPPTASHGTHVAGIIGADWDPAYVDVDPVGPPVSRTLPSRAASGMCPEIELYDLRVFNHDVGDEFAVMSALQFIRSLNRRHDAIEVHGANLSLSAAHDVANYACGRSPICEESTQLVNSGVVVVAAAGNDGRAVFTSAHGRVGEGYRTVSISDPGNAEAVITVGSTHRQEPHTYGVSYFSSRGPTGDGRMKPDLVAPGEKVYSTVPGDRYERQDGTSQAAPHVSGAAALLMSRHSELIGDPTRVKYVLMVSAIDLGRERTYQGAGLVDVFKAMQSV